MDLTPTATMATQRTQKPFCVAGMLMPTVGGPVQQALNEALDRQFNE